MSDPRLLELAQMPLHLRAQRIAELFSEGTEDQAPRAPGRLQRRAARKSRLAEKPARALARHARALTRWLAPAHVAGLARALALFAREKLAGETGRDPVAAATSEGFCGRVASLAPDDLIDVYGRGMAPRSLLGLPMLWSPSFHAVLRPSDFPRGLNDRRSEAYGVTLDEAFDPLLVLCAQQGDRDPGATAAMDLALGDLYDAGYAHSLEVWDRGGKMIAGVIGVAAGGIFVVERTYAESDDAFLRGVNNLAMQLQRWSFAMIDFGAPSALSGRLCCAHMSCEAFCALAVSHVGGGRHGRWRMAPDLRSPVQPQAAPALKIFARAQRRSETGDSSNQPRFSTAI